MIAVARTRKRRRDNFHSGALISARHHNVQGLPTVLPMRIFWQEEDPMALLMVLLLTLPVAAEEVHRFYTPSGHFRILYRTEGWMRWI